MAAAAEVPLTPEERAALAEDVDLDMAFRQRVLQTFRDLDRVSYYDLLGIHQSADKRTIKRAYYDLAATFHPDQYFRKKLGSFKVRTETIFARLTLAHDALSDDASRVEYDSYLKDRLESRSIEELMASAIAEVKAAGAAAERKARPAELAKVTGKFRDPLKPPRRAVSQDAQRAPSVAASPVKPVVSGNGTVTADDMAARRSTLAARLLGRSPTPADRPAPLDVQKMSTADAMEALKRRYELRVARAKSTMARKYITNAECALSTGDVGAAANALQIALGLAPDDPEILMLAAPSRKKVDALLSGTYTRQAEYEEKATRWIEAATTWRRVVQLLPEDAHAHERAANALLKSAGDMREALRLAARACDLDPTSVRALTVLANVRLESGLHAEAVQALNRAAQLAPLDGTILAMLKRLVK